MSLKHVLFTVSSQIRAMPPSGVLTFTAGMQVHRYPCFLNLCFLSLILPSKSGVPPSLSDAGPNWCVQLPPAVSLLCSEGSRLSPYLGYSLPLHFTPLSTHSPCIAPWPPIKWERSKKPTYVLFIYTNLSVSLLACSRLSLYWGYSLPLHFTSAPSPDPLINLYYHHTRTHWGNLLLMRLF